QPRSISRLSISNYFVDQDAWSLPLRVILIQGDPDRVLPPPEESKSLFAAYAYNQTVSDEGFNSKRVVACNPGSFRSAFLCRGGWGDHSRCPRFCGSGGG